MNPYNFFKERLGEERSNQILQEAVGKTYEELLEERDELLARIEELEKENAKLSWELRRARKNEDPVLSAVDELNDTIEDLREEVNKHATKWLIESRVSREHREGIPMDEMNIVEG